MKNILLLFFIVASSKLIIAQNPLVVNLDMLKDVQSPAASLVGIANTEIYRPSDPSAFMVSIGQATNNFTEIPLNYAVDLAPAWLFNAKNINAENFLSSKPKYSIPQSFIVSVAINNDNLQIESGNTIKNTALGIGFKFSIFRGEIHENTLAQITKSIDLARKRNKIKSEMVAEEQENSVEWQRILQQLQSSDLSEMEIEILKLQGELELLRIDKSVESKIGNWDKEFKESVDGMDFKRFKYKLDFNTATSLNFEDQIYSNAKVNKVAAWIIGGYEWGSGLSILCIMRHLYNPDEKFINELGILNQEDLSISNSGLKIQYNKNKFSCSLEAFTQKIWNNEEIESGLKYLLNTEYQVADNMKLSLTFGRDFNNKLTKEGNVISALNFLFGFGSNRRISDDINK